MPSKLAAEVTAAWNKILKIIMEHGFNKFCINILLMAQKTTLSGKTEVMNGSETKNNAMRFGL